MPPFDAMSSTSFHLVYDGPALSNGTMSARDLSSALLAADQLFADASEIINGSRSGSRLTVKASFKSGSFGIEFVSDVGILQNLRDLFNRPEATAILNAAGILGLLFTAKTSLFKFLRWLKRRRITRIVYEGESVVIYASEEYFALEQRVFDLFRSHKVRRALEDVVAKPLLLPGIDDFAVVQDNAVVAEATREEAEFFVVGNLPQEVLSDAERTTWLNIVAPAFKPGDKWRVSEGGASFFAAIADREFMDKVARNEVEFGAATRLRVALNEVQSTDEKGVLHKEATIVKVHEIKKPDWTQSDLDLPP